MGKSMVSACKVAHVAVPELEAANATVCAAWFSVAVMPAAPEQLVILSVLFGGNGELTVSPAGPTRIVPSVTVDPGDPPNVTPSIANAECEIVPLALVAVTRIGYVPSVAVFVAFSVSVPGEPALADGLTLPVTPPVIAPMLNFTVPLKPLPLTGATEI
jgi:hypothetical protein